MIIFRCLAFLGLLGITGSLSAEIIKCAKIIDAQKQIEKRIKKIKSDQILIIFDIDLTLIKAEHPALCRPNIEEHKEALREQNTKLTAEEKDLLLNLAIQKSRWSLVEKDTLNVVQHFRHQGIKTIALTTSLSGRVGCIKHAEIWRFKYLKKLGFDFSKSFSDTRCTTCYEASDHLDRHPVFYKGILFSNGGYKKHTKGEALVEFLKTIDFEPRYVVMIDDMRSNLKSVQNEIIEHNPSILFLGIEYTAGREYKSKDITEGDFMSFWSELLHTVHNEH